MPSDLQVSNIRDLNNANSAISIASDGQVTIAQNNPTLTLGTNAIFPSGHIINVYTNEYDGGSSSVGGNHTSFQETSTNVRFSYTPIATSSKMVISYQATHTYIAQGSGTSYYGIGHEVTPSDGTATPANLVSGRVTTGGGTGDADHFGFGIYADYTSNPGSQYHPLYITATHSPSYSLGQKIWYTIISKAGSWHYFTNNGDVRFQVIEIKG